VGFLTDFTFKLWVRSLPNASEEGLRRQAAFYSARLNQLSPADSLLVDKMTEIGRRLASVKAEMQRRGMLDEP